MKKNNRDKEGKWEYFCDCPICEAMKKAEEIGRNLSLLELKEAFKVANSKQKNKNKNLVFDVRMIDHKKVLRTISVPSYFSLYDLAELIVDAFGFNFDHAFGFFNKEDIFKSEQKYELFTDLINEGEDLEPTDSESVKETYLEEVWNKIGDKMFFIFDYGDWWDFEVSLVSIAEKSSEPLLLRSVGKAPKQYS